MLCSVTQEDPRSSFWNARFRRPSNRSQRGFQTPAHLSFTIRISASHGADFTRSPQ